MAVALAPGMTSVTGRLRRLFGTSAQIGAEVEIAVGQHIFTVHHNAVPGVNDGDRVTLLLSQNGTPLFWDLTPGQEHKDLNLPKARFTNLVLPPGSVSRALFNLAYSVPILTNDAVVKALLRIPTYKNLQSPPWDSDSHNVFERFRSITEDPVLSRYQIRFGKANAWLFLTSICELKNAEAQSVMRTGGASLSLLMQNPYALAYGVDAHNVRFSTLDAIAEATGRRARDVDRVRAALFLAVQNLVLSQKALSFPVERALNLTERNLQEYAKEHPLSAISKAQAQMTMRPLIQDAWDTLVQVEYTREWDGQNKNGRPRKFGTVGLIELAVRMAGKRMARQSLRAVTAISPGKAATPLLATLDPKQTAAVNASLKNPLSVVVGGAGRGKSHVLAATAIAAATAGKSVLVAAPTGRAAVRVKSLLGQIAQQRNLQIPNIPCMTLHQALNMTPTTFGGVQNMQLADVTLVDETSMLDAVVARKLLHVAEQTPECHLTFYGDNCQLPAVGVGEFLDNLLIKADPGDIHRLTQSHRTINNPAMLALDTMHDAVEAAQTGDKAKAESLAATAMQMLEAAATVDWVHQPTDVSQAILNAVNTWTIQRPGESFIVLTPYRKARQLNAENLNWDLHRMLTGNAAQMMPGEPVIVRRTGEYAMPSGGSKLVPNGTPGRIERRVGDVYVVSVDDPMNVTGKAEILLHAAAAGVTFELGYVDTVHSAQGGEVSHVIIVGDLGDQGDGMQVQWSYPLLYTALSRVHDQSAAMLGKVTVIGELVAATLSMQGTSRSVRRSFASGWAKGMTP